MIFIKDLVHKGMAGVIIEVRIQPNASKNQVIGLYGEKLKIKIQSPPIDGKANECVILFFSELLKTAKSRIHILRGDTSREKTLFIENISAIMAITELKKCCSALN